MLAAAALLVVLAVAPSSGASHDATSPEAMSVANAKLPFGGLYGTSAAWDGSRYAYLFGGLNETGAHSDAILRYDSLTDQVTAMDARLPSARTGTAAVWFEGSAYVFGGSARARQGSHSYTIFTDEIVMYDPANDNTSIMTARLPTARWGSSAVTDKHDIFLFGGFDGGSPRDILRYDPVADRIQAMKSSFPGGLTLSTVWSGSLVYIWGAGPNVTSYDPLSDSYTITRARPPPPDGISAGGSAVWDGQASFLFGGFSHPYPVPTIMRFDPQTETVKVLNTSLPPEGPPAGRARTSAVWTGHFALVFGGEQRSRGDYASDEILRFHPGPESKTASASPTAGTDDTSPSVSGVRGLPSLTVPLLLSALVCVAVFRRI